MEPYLGTYLPSVACVVTSAAAEKPSRRGGGGVDSLPSSLVHVSSLSSVHWYSPLSSATLLRLIFQDEDECHDGYASSRGIGSCPYKPICRSVGPPNRLGRQRPVASNRGRGEIVDIDSTSTSIHRDEQLLCGRCPPTPELLYCWSAPSSPLPLSKTRPPGPRNHSLVSFPLLSAHAGTQVHTGQRRCRFCAMYSARTHARTHASLGEYSVPDR